MEAIIELDTMQMLTALKKTDDVFGEMGVDLDDIVRF